MAQGLLVLAGSSGLEPYIPGFKSLSPPTTYPVTDLTSPGPDFFVYEMGMTKAGPHRVRDGPARTWCCLTR